MPVSKGVLRCVPRYLSVFSNRFQLGISIVISAAVCGVLKRRSVNGGRGQSLPLTVRKRRGREWCKKKKTLTERQFRGWKRPVVDERAQGRIETRSVRAYRKSTVTHDHSFMIANTEMLKLHSCFVFFSPYCK